jgi:Raf kinase inhibitor-like YbhB/YbcL family protein
MKKHLACTFLALALASTAYSQSPSPSDQPTPPKLRLSSTTLTSGGTLPLSMALGSNFCAFVSGGGDQSPELSWVNVPAGTKSFVVTMYDITAGFTHWGMYNIPVTTTKLPAGAGVAGSKFGLQIFNDFFLGPEYDGPCPPNTFTPLNHEYLITVYALDSNIDLVASPPNFPAGAETLYRFMIGHVIDRSSIEGFFSSAN